jgi:hypothetical protein
VNLAIQVEKWRVYWNSVTDSHEVERQLRKLHWLEEFAFHSGAAISGEQYAALQQQIRAGEAKLSELSGGVQETLFPPASQTHETAWGGNAGFAVPETHDFEAAAR